MHVLPEYMHLWRFTMLYTNCDVYYMYVYIYIYIVRIKVAMCKALAMQEDAVIMHCLYMKASINY